MKKGDLVEKVKDEAMGTLGLNDTSANAKLLLNVLITAEKISVNGIEHKNR